MKIQKNRGHWIGLFDLTLSEILAELFNVCTRRGPNPLQIKHPP
jgi:hypothetical protein